MNPRIASDRNYVAGWLDSSIHDFLRAFPPDAPEVKYALVTCLDSFPNVASLCDKSPHLKSIAKKMTVVGGGLLVKTKLLLDADSHEQIFFGFDELWFFPSMKVQPKPPSVTLVGPARLNQARLRKIGKWMAANSCSLALGGGEGLNFVVRLRAQRLVKFLLGYSIEQREPDLVSS